MINWYVTVGLSVKVLTLLSLLVYVVPLQIKELNRPVRDLRILIVRLTLTGMVFIFEILNLPGILYQFTRLDTEPVFNQQNVASVATNLGVAALAIGFIVIYRLSAKLASNKD